MEYGYCRLLVGRDDVLGKDEEEIGAPLLEDGLMRVDKFLSAYEYEVMEHCVPYKSLMGERKFVDEIHQGIYAYFCWPSSAAAALSATISPATMGW